MKCGLRTDKSATCGVIRVQRFPILAKIKSNGPPTIHKLSIREGRRGGGGTEDKRGWHGIPSSCSSRTDQINSLRITCGLDAIQLASVRSCVCHSTGGLVAV